MPPERKRRKVNQDGEDLSAAKPERGRLRGTLGGRYNQARRTEVKRERPVGWGAREGSIIWDLETWRWANTSASWYAESRNRKKDTCPANINESKKGRYVQPKQKTRQRGHHFNRFIPRRARERVTENRDSSNGPFQRLRSAKRRVKEITSRRRCDLL